MLTWRITGTDQHGNKVVGDWQKDVPLILKLQISTWIDRGLNFSVEFKA